MLPGPKDVAEPHKELRFTRSAQGRLFFLLGSTFLTIAIFLAAASVTAGLEFPLWWAAFPLVPALPSFLLAYHCIRHAYLILTPLGVELFPFFNPRRQLLVLYWSEIDHAEVSDDHRTLTIHYNKDRTSGLQATLAPILAAKRPLLARAIEGRMAEQARTTC
jgi:hypothetical protein